MTGSKLIEAVPKERVRLSDWSGLTDFGGDAEVFAPRNESEICSVVRYCASQGKKLRVVGLRTSWNSLWYSPEVMLSTSRLNAIKEIDPVGHTVTCGAGVTLTDLHRELWAKGLTLETAPGVDWVTIGGALATGSHGSGPPSISSSLISCRLVTAGGEAIEIGEHDERLDAVRLSMGMLGILSEVTLKVVDAFYVRLTRTGIPVSQWKRCVTDGDMSMTLWFAHTDSSVLVKVDILSKAEVEELKPGPLPEDDAPLVEKYVTPITEFAQLRPSAFPARNRYLRDVFFGDGEVIGPAHQILMSFIAPGPIAGAEWSVPVARFGDAMADMEKEMAAGLYLPGPVWLKHVKPETAWLSAADEHCIQCGIYHMVIPTAPSPVKDMVSRMERLMLRHGGRPHLGKLIYLDPEDLKSAYPNWGKFEALRREMDPAGVFWTERMEERFGG
jgi:FAD/FMN-containing dehydrogenase